MFFGTNPVANETIPINQRSEPNHVRFVLASLVFHTHPNASSVPHLCNLPRHPVSLPGFFFPRPSLILHPRNSSCFFVALVSRDPKAAQHVTRTHCTAMSAIMVRGDVEDVVVFHEKHKGPCSTSSMMDIVCNRDHIVNKPPLQGRPWRNCRRAVSLGHPPFAARLCWPERTLIWFARYHHH